MKQTVQRSAFLNRLVAAGLVTAGLTASFPVLAQSPYWDNSSDNAGSNAQQPYYNPSGSSSSGGYTAPRNNTQQYNNSYSNPYGNQNYSQNQYDNNSGYNQGRNLQGYVATAPAGTNLTTTTASYLSSDSARVGDPVVVTLNYDMSMGGNMLLPSGTQIQGQVVSAIPAGRAGRNGQLQLRFHSAMLPDGRTIPLSARLITQDGTGIIRGGTSAQRAGGYAKNTLGGAAIGAASGAALGALVSGGRKWNEGLLWGSILGAGGGLARSTVNRGEEAQLQPGTQLQLMLDQPLTVTNN